MLNVLGLGKHKSSSICKVGIHIGKVVQGFTGCLNAWLLIFQCYIIKGIHIFQSTCQINFLTLPFRHIDSSTGTSVTLKCINISIILIIHMPYKWLNFIFSFLSLNLFFYNLKTRRNNIHNNIIIFFTQAVYLLQRQINGEKNNKNKTWFIDPTTYYLKLHNYYPFWTASCDCLTICARSGHKIQLGRSVSNFLVLRTFVCSQRIYSCINIFNNKTNGSYFIPNYLLTRNAVFFFSGRYIHLQTSNKLSMQMLKLLATAVTT